MTRLNRLAITIGVGVVALVLPRTVRAEQAPTQPVMTLPLTASTNGAETRVDLMRAAIRVSLDSVRLATDALTGGRSRADDAAGRWLRAARLVAIDVPVSQYLVSLNHEFGHIYRAREVGIRSELDFVGTPWSARRFDLSGNSRRAGRFDFGLESGGLEASWELKDRIERQAFADGAIGPSDALAAFWAGVNTAAYAVVNLNDDPRLFGQPAGGDLAHYVFQLARDGTPAMSPPGEELVRRSRRRAQLGLLDTALWGQVVGLLYHYVWQGRDDLPVPTMRVGGVRLQPSLRYAFSAVGPEVSVRSRFARGDHLGVAYVRWIDEPGGDRQRGWGIGYDGPHLRGVVPHVVFNYWTAAGEPRAHAEVAGTIVGHARYLPGVTIAVGGKDEGYVQGQLLAASWYLSVRLRVPVY